MDKIHEFCPMEKLFFGLKIGGHYTLILPNGELRDIIMANYISRNLDKSINDEDTREIIDLVISSNADEKLDAIANTISTF